MVVDIAFVQCCQRQGILLALSGYLVGAVHKDASQLLDIRIIFRDCIDTQSLLLTNVMG